MPTPATAKQGNFRYNAAGVPLPEEEPQIHPTARTQMPPTQHPPTIPAAKSGAEQALAAQGGMGRNPKAAPMSQASMKVNNIKKALDKIGFTGTPEGAKKATHGLRAWYDSLDPSDALVATADELAARFAGEG